MEASQNFWPLSGELFGTSSLHVCTKGNCWANMVNSYVSMVYMCMYVCVCVCGPDKGKRCGDGGWGLGSR